MKTIFENLKSGLEEAIEHQKGTIHLQTETIEVSETKNNSHHDERLEKALLIKTDKYIS